MSRGGYDGIVLKVRKSSMAYVWGKFLGLSTTDDQGMGCAVDDEGGVFGTTLTT